MIVKRIVLVALAALAVLYGGDYLRLRYKMWNPKAGDAFGSVTVFDTLTLKGGKTEVLFDQPQTVVCVNSLFPHFGDSPCWYASRKTMKSLD
jgi:hypothetical protein